MKKPVMQRSMFVAVAPKSESKGILSGFDEEMDNENYEDRSPENLEIIANNLRGDMRSMDERYLELAQMVGESAFETPEEVVALMQSQMGQQGTPPTGQAPAPSAGGVAALGAPPMPSAPQGIMQGIAEPGMEQQMPQPGMEQPMQMAQGGMVYRQAGSPLTGEVAPGRRMLGFMRFMEPGDIPDPRTMDPRSTAVPRVQLQQTPAMARSFVGPIPQNATVGPLPNFVGSVSPEGARFLQSGAARPGTLPPLPQQIPLATRFSSNIAEAMRSAPGFAREASRTLMATPIGKGAAVVGAGLGLLGVDQAYRNLVSPQGPASSGQPAVSEVPGVDAQGRYTAVPLASNLIPSDTGAAPPGEFNAAAALEKDDAGRVIEQVRPSVPVPIPSAAPPLPGANVAEKEDKDLDPRPKTYDERVQDRLGVFTKYLGSDPEMRKAQALFLLAEAALNVAGAPGRSTAERLTKGLKGFPAGMAALGAEADKERRSIAASAISAVESDIQATAKYNQQVALQAAKSGPAREKLIRNANFYMNRDGITQDMLKTNPGIAERYIGMAQLIEDKTLVQDKSGDLVDPLGRPVPGFSRAAPTPANGIGYLDPANPLVKVSETFVTPATTDEKVGLITTKANNEQLIMQINSAMDHLNKSVGLGPSIRAGITNIFAPITGDVGLGLTDIQTQALRSKDRLLQDVLVKAKLRNPKAPVWEQKNIKEVIGNPSSIVQSWEEYTSVVNNILQELLNENAMIDARLNPGQPLKQIDRMPTGTKTDPLAYSPNVFVTLEGVFKNRPNAKVWVAGKDENGKDIAPFQIDGKRFMEQLNAQRGQPQ